MKKLFLTVMLVAVFCVGTASADTYPQVTLYENGVSPLAVGTYVFPNYGQASAYTGQYILNVNGTNIGGFCVEDVLAPSAPTTYELVSPQALDNIVKNSSYEQAAWLFSHYASIDPVATQIAIWKVVLDNGEIGLSLTDPAAEFRVLSIGSDNSETAIAQGYVNSLPTDLSAFNSSVYAIAVNPVGSEGTIAGYQNYILPVPEPCVLIFLAASLIGTAIGGKRLRNREI